MTVDEAMLLRIGEALYRSPVLKRMIAISKRYGPDSRCSIPCGGGTPALTVAAGAMSRSILERLGFVAVGTADVLRDTLAQTPPTARAQPGSKDSDTRER